MNKKIIDESIATAAAVLLLLAIMISAIRVGAKDRAIQESIDKIITEERTPINIPVDKFLFLVKERIQIHNGRIRGSLEDEAPIIASMSLYAKDTRISQIFSASNYYRLERGVDADFPVVNFEPVREKVRSLLESVGNRPTHSGIQEAMDGNTLRGGVYFIEEVSFRQPMISKIFIPEGENVSIVTNRLYASSARIEGNGNLTIYVREGIRNFVPGPNNTSFGRIDNEHKLVVYVEKTKLNTFPRHHVEFSAGTRIGGFFMFEDARVAFRNDVDVSGGVVTGAMDTNRGNAITLLRGAALGRGGGHTLLVAPNGSVVFGNSSQFVGAAISKNLVINGGFNPMITSAPDALSNIPFLEGTIWTHHN